MGDDKLTVKLPQIILDSNLRFADSAQDKDDKESLSQLTINRQRCVNPTLVDSFLRLLRHGSDDVLKQRLNMYSRDEEMNKCEVVKEELYENWNIRLDIINFCEEQSRQIKETLDLKYGSNASLSEHKIDPRIDPYAARDQLDSQEAKYAEWKKVKQWVQNNSEIESILQGTSDKILRQKCNQNTDYLKQFYDTFQKK
ncbi:hypothetical protein NCAS_0E03030 [Naumovozyma castellii]|uniref:Uncharacterized protein n=1 Tax=Naumovozyma castellii TaxID=27288 RepID=G0VFV4_NAUCA|nr:hypothetical protein NCAS_0E03030 [Naumovozyma castellii CBS 4309]CCC70373.1 hypothetical protein NCAS_0E03030 [Naumovozyma castellii CBS 4309]